MEAEVETKHVGFGGLKVGSMPVLCPCPSVLSCIMQGPTELTYQSLLTVMSVYENHLIHATSNYIKFCFSTKS